MCFGGCGAAEGLVEAWDVDDAAAGAGEACAGGVGGDLEGAAAPSLIQLKMASFSAAVSGPESESSGGISAASMVSQNSES